MSQIEGKLAEAVDAARAISLGLAELQQLTELLYKEGEQDERH